MKPGPRCEADHTGPDLIGASSTDYSERNGKDSLSAESAWSSTSILLAIASDADLAGRDMIYVLFLSLKICRYSDGNRKSCSLKLHAQM